MLKESRDCSIHVRIVFRNGSSSSNGHPSSSSSTWKMSRVFSESDESLINRKLPKELLLRIFSWLDIVALCRCAQVYLETRQKRIDNNHSTEDALEMDRKALGTHMAPVHSLNDLNRYKD